MQFVLRTPEKTCFDGPIERLSGATELGELQVYPGHAAMTATISFSRLKIEKGEHVETFMVRQGFLHTDPDANRTEVVCLVCSKLNEMDVKSLREYREFILQKLEKHEDLNQYQVKHLTESQAAVEKQLEETDNA